MRTLLILYPKPTLAIFCATFSEIALIEKLILKRVKELIEEIKDKISKIVCEKPMSRKTEEILGAAVISAEKLQIHDFGQFAAVKKEALDREIDKKSVFRKIIISYKKEKEAILMSHS